MYSVLFVCIHPPAHLYTLFCTTMCVYAHAYLCTRMHWRGPHVPSAFVWHAAARYTFAIDMWGVGCIVAELFTGTPILQGGVLGARDESENDIDQVGGGARCLVFPAQCSLLGD